MTDDTKTARIRIVSDGTPRGTRVETEDGRLIKGVQDVRWELAVDGFAHAFIEVLAVPVDVVGLVEHDGSMPEDPTAVPLLAKPQEPPEGPGFGGVSVFSREECIFRYCPNPDLCPDECEHRRS